MRLRALRKLEEIEIKREHKELSEEKRNIEQLLGSTGRQWTEVKRQLKAAREIFDPTKKLGRRRSNFGEANEIDTEAAIEALIVKEPVTVVLSNMGWIRALKGHNQKLDDLKFKEGDELALSLECQTTDKVVLMASGGRAFTIGADKLPGGRGHGEPIRLNLEVPEAETIVGMFVPEEKGRRIVASTKGYGFIVPDAELVSSTRKGKIILNVGDEELAVCIKVAGDMTAIDRRQPQDGHLQDRRAARNGARQGREDPGLQGWRPRRHQDLQQGRRLVVGRLGRTPAVER